MPEVLSQSQIDALLNSMNSGGDKPPAEEEKPEKKYRKYDFTNPKKFTKDRLKMLKSIFDNYSRVLTTRINGLVHATCEIEVESVEETTYFEFSNALSDSAVLTTTHLMLKENREETPVLCLSPHYGEHDGPHDRRRWRCGESARRLHLYGAGPEAV